MREYEVTYILDPALTDADVENSLAKTGEIIGRHHGHILRSQNMGKKSLAYRVKKSSKGYYVYLDFCADSTVVSEIERTFKLDERVLRFLTVRLNDDVDVETRKKEILDEAAALEAAMKLANEGVAVPPQAGVTIHEEVENAQENR